MKKTLVFIFVLGCASGAKAALHTESVTYKQGKAVLEGYLVYDDATQAKRPGVIVVHEWMGLNESAKRHAREVASLGYVAFAADIYGKGVVATDTKKAAELSSIYKSDRNLMRARMDAALQTMKAQKFVDTDKIASIGYCFGGTCSLELARSGANVDGVVSFHGGLDSPTPADGKNIHTKVLVLRGADDPYVSKENIAAFEEEMRGGKVDWQENVYANAVHGFTNPDAGTDNSKGYAYNEQATKRSWEAMKTFFAEIFK